jgi:hypothetical protein
LIGLHALHGALDGFCAFDPSATHQISDAYKSIMLSYNLFVQLPDERERALKLGRKSGGVTKEIFKIRADVLVLALQACRGLMMPTSGAVTRHQVPILAAE